MNEENYLSESILDLFCEHENDAYWKKIEEQAAKYQVTCDYILQEFILDKK
jgi:hypothetical protein